VVSRTSNVFQPFRQIVKYTTLVSGLPATTILPHEDFFFPFEEGSAEPTDPNFNSFALYSIVGRCATLGDPDLSLSLSLYAARCG
jgi:hypothetical protein